MSFNLSLLVVFLIFVFSVVLIVLVVFVLIVLLIIIHHNHHPFKSGDYIICLFQAIYTKSITDKKLKAKLNTPNRLILMCAFLSTDACF